MPNPALLLASCLLVVSTAALVVLLRRPVRVAVALLAHSLSLAMLYLLLDAQLMAAAQTVIYSGAIVVLFLIVVALLPAGGREPPARWVSIVFGVAVAASVCTTLFLALDGAPAPATFAPAAPDARGIGRPLFHELLGAFELTAPLLLAALVGAITLWRRHEPAPKEPTP